MMDRASGCFATTPIFGQVRLMASRFGSCKAQNKKLAITNINIDTKIKDTKMNMKINISPCGANGKQIWEVQYLKQEIAKYKYNHGFKY